jgi:hypothetical protein
MSNSIVENGVKLVGERFLPGTSLIVDCDIKGGLAHAALGVVALATSCQSTPPPLTVQWGIVSDAPE